MENTRIYLNNKEILNVKMFLNPLVGVGCYLLYDLRRLKILGVGWLERSAELFSCSSGYNFV